MSLPVPVWLIILSRPATDCRLQVSRYLTNKLIRRKLILNRKPKPSFSDEPESSKGYPVLIRFPRLSSVEADYSRVTHPFAAFPRAEALVIARLACVKRAASVRPEPGSNSP